MDNKEEQLTKKDAAVIKVLTDLGYKEEEELTPDQEDLLQYALNKHK